jgi:hypothetical protein
MAKLSKAQAKAHAQACELLAKDTLSVEDRWFVLENWQESAQHVNSTAGAFFTPVGLARDFAIELSGRRIIDLCAGIGCLAHMVWNRHLWGGPKPEIVCVEINPDYIAVGKKVLPEATWIQASVFDLPDLGKFDCAIANPPFGSTKRGGQGPRFRGREFEYHVIDIASDLAEYGVFIIPQGAAPFRYSGAPCYEAKPSDGYNAFKLATGIELAAGCGIDTEYYIGDWRGVAPKTEIVCADFAEARASRQPAQASLFTEAA